METFAFSTGTELLQGVQALLKNGFMVFSILPDQLNKHFSGVVRKFWRRMVVAPPSLQKGKNIAQI